MNETNVVSAAEHAGRLNRCLGAGLTVVYRYKPSIVPEGSWTEVDKNTDYVIDEDFKMHEFLVLRPGETVDNFTLPEGY